MSESTAIVGRSTITEHSARQEELRREAINNARPTLSPEEIYYATSEILRQNPEIAERIQESRMDQKEVQLGLTPNGLSDLGPCSIDERLLEEGTSPAIHVTKELYAAGQQYSDSHHARVRLNAEKPRSSVGWAGLFNSENGVEHALSEIYLPAIVEVGAPITFETMDQRHYGLRDFATGVWIGLRSNEHPPLREQAAFASDVPTAFKINWDETTFSNLTRKLRSGGEYNHDSYIGSKVSSLFAKAPGNPYIHAIVRGEDNNNPVDFPQRLMNLARLAYAERVRLQVDVSHGNRRTFLNYDTQTAREINSRYGLDVRPPQGSVKPEEGQLYCFDVLEAMLQQNPRIIEHGEHGAPRDIHLRDIVMGVMAEVYLHDGCGDAPGSSRTDPTISLERGLDIQRRFAAIDRLRHEDWMTNGMMYSKEILKNEFGLKI